MTVISKQTILNNFEWIQNSQVAMDMLEINVLRNEFNEIYELIKKLLPDDLVIDADILELEYYNGGRLYNLFKSLNSIKSNKDTYLPNIVGIYLIHKMTYI